MKKFSLSLLPFLLINFAFGQIDYGVNDGKLFLKIKNTGDEAISVAHARDSFTGNAIDLFKGNSKFGYAVEGWVTASPGETVSVCTIHRKSHVMLAFGKRGGWTKFAIKAKGMKQGPLDSLWVKTSESFSYFYQKGSKPPTDEYISIPVSSAFEFVPGGGDLDFTLEVPSMRSDLVRSFQGNNAITWEQLQAQQLAERNATLSRYNDLILDNSGMTLGPVTISLPPTKEMLVQALGEPVRQGSKYAGDASETWNWPDLDLEFIFESKADKIPQILLFDLRANNKRVLSILGEPVGYETTDKELISKGYMVGEEIFSAGAGNAFEVSELDLIVQFEPGIKDPYGNPISITDQVIIYFDREGYKAQVAAYRTFLENQAAKAKANVDPNEDIYKALGGIDDRIDYFFANFYSDTRTPKEPLLKFIGDRGIQTTSSGWNGDIVQNRELANKRPAFILNTLVASYGTALKCRMEVHTFEDSFYVDFERDFLTYCKMPDQALAYHRQLEKARTDKHFPTLTKIQRLYPQVYEHPLDVVQAFIDELGLEGVEDRFEKFWFDDPRAEKAPKSSEAEAVEEPYTSQRGNSRMPSESRRAPVEDAPVSTRRAPSPAEKTSVPQEKKEKPINEIDGKSKDESQNKADEILEDIERGAKAVETFRGIFGR